MDVILRIATATLLIGLSLGVIARPQPWRWALCFVAVALGVSAFVVNNAASDVLIIRSWSWLWITTTILAKTVVLSVWLFVQCSFDDGFRFDRVRVLVSLAWIGVLLTDMRRTITGISGPFDFASIIFALILMVHLIWTLLRDRDGDLRLRRRTARIWLSAIMVSLLLLDLIIDMTMGFSWRPTGFVYVQNGLILMAVLALAMAIVRIDGSAIAPNPQPKDTPDHQLSEHAAKLNHIMHTEQLHLRPELRLSDVVTRLPISEAATRTLIHNEFGHGHFRNFLNHYRIQHAQDLLRSPDNHGNKLMAIAFDSGFASLASFQRAFKKEVGLTASQWREQQKPR